MKQNLKRNLTSAFLVLVLLWIIELIDVILPVDLVQFGIVPRNIVGLRGILFAPFLHAGWYHLISNSLPLFVLLTTLFTFYGKISIQVCVFSAILGGLTVWLIARSGTVHVGASGVIFSLLTFLIASGVFRKNFKALLIALVIFFLYGGALWGVLPSNPYISWEGHLFGAIAGILIAWIYRNTSVSESAQ